MSFLGDMLHYGSYTVDPFNSFGTRSQDTVYGPGSTVSNPNGPSQKSDPAEEARAEEAQRQLWLQQQADAAAAAPGYMRSMIPHGDHSSALTSQVVANRQMPAAPPSQWTYQAGKGPVWQTPERTIDRSASSPTDMNWKLTDAKSGSPYGGNRF